MCNQNRKISISEDIHCSLEMNREGLAEKKGAGPTKRNSKQKSKLHRAPAGKIASQRQESANKPFESVGNRHCR